MEEKLGDEHTMEQIKLPRKLSEQYIAYFQKHRTDFLMPSWKGVDLSSLLNPVNVLLGMRIPSPHQITIFWREVQNLGPFFLYFQELYIISPHSATA